MAENMNENGGLNTGMDLSSYMVNAKADKEETAAKETPTSAPVQQEKSPLDQMIEKQQAEGHGMVINKDTYKAEEEEKKLRNPIDSIEREEGIKERMNEEDQKLINRKAVVLIRRPQNPAEYARVDYELESLKYDADGKPYWDMKDTDNLGNEVNDPPQYFIIRTAEYGEYDPQTEALYSLGKKPEEVMKAKADGTITKQLEDDTFEEPADKIEEEKKLVQILIDKTGYGKKPIEFSSDEKKTIYESDQILLTSTKKFDIASIKINVNNPDAPKKTFQATAVEHQLSDSHTSVAFPLSGFHGQVSGMSYGEMRDICLDPDMIGFNNVRKQISVFYNKLKNLSCQPFKDIDDFMKHFAFNDFNMGLYALYVSTFPEMQGITLTCGNKSCGREFEHQFNTRSIIQFNHCPDAWLTRYKELISASPYDYERLAKEAPVNNLTYIQLPFSGYVVGIGVVTLYDYLYKLIPVNDPTEFRRLFGENPNRESLNYLSTCLYVREVLVPDGTGSYDKYEDLKDVLDVLNSLQPEEVKLVTSLADDIRYKSEPFIGVENVVCPNCGAKTRLVPLDVSNLLFLARETLQNTTVDVSKWRPM